MEFWWLAALAGLVVLLNFLPLISAQHWAFRIWDFGRPQLTVLALLLGVLILWLVRPLGPWALTAIAGLAAAIGYNTYLLFPYTRLYPQQRPSSAPYGLRQVTLLSANVYQPNTDYHRFLQLVREKDPDFILTMESNKGWEEALQVLQDSHPHYLMCAQENTYGMHFYSRIPFASGRINRMVSQDIPSFEIDFDEPGLHFKLYCVHPPPPSPSEEPTSKERDGELMVLADRVSAHKGPTVVVGDFNNVAWARSSRLFRRIAGLIDPRIGRGMLSTFHSKYPLLRFPIDLYFHTEEVVLTEFSALGPFGSDHFPLYCRFGILSQAVGEPAEKADGEDKREAEHMKREGMETQGER